MKPFDSLPLAGSSQLPGLLVPYLDLSYGCFHTPTLGTHRAVAPVTHTMSQPLEGGTSTMARLNE